MSPSLRRVSLPSVTSVLACAPMLALGACHHASSTVHNPSPTARVVVESGHRSNGEQALPRFPGVDLIRMPSGGFVARVLGGSVGDGQPLYVIDGAPVMVQPSRGIDWLRLEDVAQIKVLKHPGETSVYGPRSVNGVIVITTKLAAALRRRGG